MGYPVINVTRSYDWMNSAYVTQVIHFSTMMD